MSFNNLIKIAVSLKQLEENSNRAIAKGKLDLNVLPDENFYDDRTVHKKIMDAIPEHRKNDARFVNKAKDLGGSHFRSFYVTSSAPGSHSAPNTKALIERVNSPVFRFYNENKGAKSAERAELKNIPLGQRKELKQVLGKAVGYGVPHNATVRSMKDMEDFQALPNMAMQLLDSPPDIQEMYKSMGIKMPTRSKETYQKRLDRLKTFNLPDHVMSPHVDKNTLNEADKALFKAFEDEREGKIRDVAGRPVATFLRPTEDSKAFAHIVANHELNEQNPKIKGGGRHTMISSSHASSKVPLNDFNVINTMGKEAPMAQAIMRDVRDGEIQDMRSLSPGLNRILEPISGGEEGFQERITNRAKQMQADNKAHNQKILSRVPEHKHSHPVVQARLKPTDADVVRDLAEGEVRKSGRFNRHMQNHIANILDNNPIVHEREQKRLKLMEDSFEKQLKDRPDLFDKKFKINYLKPGVQRNINKARALVRK
jgi:hypothetical protein